MGSEAWGKGTAGCLLGNLIRLSPSPGCHFPPLLQVGVALMSRADQSPLSMQPPSWYPLTPHHPLALQCCPHHCSSLSCTPSQYPLCSLPAAALVTARPSKPCLSPSSIRKAWPARAVSSTEWDLGGRWDVAHPVSRRRQKRWPGGPAPGLRSSYPEGFQEEAARRGWHGQGTEVLSRAGGDGLTALREDGQAQHRPGLQVSEGPAGGELATQPAAPSLAASAFPYKVQASKKRSLQWASPTCCLLPKQP